MIQENTRTDWISYVHHFISEYICNSEKTVMAIQVRVMIEEYDITLWASHLTLEDCTTCIPQKSILEVGK